MLIAVTAGLLSAAAVGLALPLLARWVPDVPGARSSHRTSIPRGGGVFVVGVVVALAVVLRWDVLPLLAAVSALTTLGFIDDLVSLPAGPRLLAQAIAAAVLVWWAIALGDPATSVSMFAIVGVVFVVGYINAFNFMDGINGISGVTAGLAAAWFSLHLGRLGQDDLALFAAALVGASSGFLPWNFPRARVFLGDAGSYGVGSALAALAVVGAASGASLVVCLAPIMLYVGDTVAAMVMQRQAGHSWSQPHRSHVYQRLVDSGLSHARVTAIVGATIAMCCGLSYVPQVPLALALQVLVVLLYLLLPRLRRTHVMSRSA